MWERVTEFGTQRLLLLLLLLLLRTPSPPNWKKEPPFDFNHTFRLHTQTHRHSRSRLLSA